MRKKTFRGVMRKHGYKSLVPPEIPCFAECGDGWADIVDRLITDLKKLGWNGNIHQIKEKFGGLRFYIGSGNDKIFDRITEAENESFETCSTCGKPGKPSTWGGWWILTLCPKHGGERRKKNDTHLL